MFARAIAAGILLVIVPGIAAAHHVMDGRLPDSLVAGLLSGVGHPIIGWDHLAFVVGVGVLSAVAGLGARPVLGFVLGTVGGCLVRLAGMDVPVAETIVAASLFALAVIVALRWRQQPALAVALAGLFHGYAYGESIVGAEPAPVLAYLAGFAIVQAAIGLGVGEFVRRILAPDLGMRLIARVSAVLLALVGAAALIA